MTDFYEGETPEQRQEWMQEKIKEHERIVSAMSQSCYNAQMACTEEVEAIMDEYFPADESGRRLLTSVGQARIIAELHSLRARVEELEKAIDNS